MNFCNSLRPSSTCKKLVEREVAYNDSKCLESLAEYSPFSDIHLREYWMLPSTRRILVKMGFLDEEGKKLLDPDKERRKFAAVEKAICAARERILVQKMKRRNRLLSESSQLQREIVNIMKYDHVQSRRTET